MTKNSLPSDLHGLTRAEWEQLINECAIDEETEIICRMYVFQRKTQNMIADRLQEYGIFISRSTVTRRWREFVERAASKRRS